MVLSRGNPIALAAYSAPFLSCLYSRILKLMPLLLRYFMARVDNLTSHKNDSVLVRLKMFSHLKENSKLNLDLHML